MTASNPLYFELPTTLYVNKQMCVNYVKADPVSQRENVIAEVSPSHRSTLSTSETNNCRKYRKFHHGKSIVLSG